MVETSRSASSAVARNLFAVTAASFMGFTGFTLVMPFLPLYIRQLGVTDLGAITMWTGISLGITPAITALLSPIWGKLADRFGRKIMVERSLISFSVLMAATAFVTKPWHVLAIRAVQGIFAGYGAICVTMAAESAPRDRMAQSIGVVQTAQRLGPAVGPVIGGVLAGLLGLRHAFLVTAASYAAALGMVFFMYDERVTHAAGEREATGPVRFRDVLAFENFILIMAVVFGIQFVDKSFEPVLPLYIEQIGTAHRLVPLLTGIVLSIVACTGALGHHFCGKLLRRHSPQAVIASATAVGGVGVALFAIGRYEAVLMVAAALVGAGIGAAMTAAYTAAGSVMPPGSQGTGFGVLSSAPLVALAVSPVVAGFLGATSIRAVFLVDVVLMGVAAIAVRQRMGHAPGRA